MALAFASSSGGGGGSGVQSVTAGDTSIVVGGTATNPTVETADLATIAADHATSGNVALNSHKITGLANGTAASDAAAFGQIPSVPVASVFGRTGAVVAANGDYEGVIASALTGATAATRYVGGTTSGAPASGTFAVGDFVVAQNGHMFVCTVAGTPGTWVDVGSVSNAVTSVFGRTGAVVATSGDYTLNQIGNATADYSINSHKLTNLTDPASAQDAATKHYVDSVVPGNAGGKGHLTTATAVNTPADLAPGSDGTVLTADSTASTGLAYSVQGGWWQSGIPGVICAISPTQFNSVQTYASAPIIVGARIVIPKTGTLHDISIFLTTAAGNIDVGLYDTAATTRNRVYHSGAAAAPAASAWRVVADPALSVTAGDQYDLAMGISATTCGILRFPGQQNAQTSLPSGFDPVSGGGVPLLVWSTTGASTLPATLSEASLSAHPSVLGIMARLA